MESQGPTWELGNFENQSLRFKQMQSLCTFCKALLSFVNPVFLGANKTKILEFLCDVWIKDRRAEWSIWMVYSKVEMPHHYMSSGSDDSSHHGHRRVLSLMNPAQSAATRADLHRRSIAQMRINNRSIQDMYIFGDLLRIPIIIVERVTNAPRRTLSENSYFKNLDLVDAHSSHSGPGTESEAGKKQPSAVLSKNGRELKAVVFVHGFQARLALCPIIPTPV
ncbi:hypothetical protein OIU85_003256 [Salix viminalis]|uniref:DUF676 domain-containing protein n=1 Tax=Salix viminalis TaxID=40686 RepID=A0A9Q0PYS9_SALVM|nr:hypothetical protein OIU85_003256 [Salix viminalis]